MMLVVLVVPSPASADGVAAGTITGAVDFNPGIPLDLFSAHISLFSFNTTTAPGTFTVTEGSTTVTFAGSVAVQLSGWGLETPLSGAGNVNAATAVGSTTQGGISTSITLSQVAAAGTGTNRYLRVGSHVHVGVRMRATVTQSAGGVSHSASSDVSMLVDGELAPNRVGSETPPIFVTGAGFAGFYAATSLA